MNKNKKNEVANKKKKQTIVAEKQRKPGNSGLRFAEKLSYLISQVSFVSSNSLNEW